MVLILLIDSCFSFTLHMTTPPVWLWLGFGVLLARKPQQQPQATRLRVLWLTAPLTLLALIALIPPVLTEIYLKKTVVVAKEGAFGEAAEALAMAHHYYPGNPRGADRSLVLAIEQQDYDRALKWLQIFQKRNPYHPNGFMQKALIHYFTDQPEKALAALNDAEKYGTPDGRMRYLRSRLLDQTGKDEQARALLETTEESERQLHALISWWF